MTQNYYTKNEILTTILPNDVWEEINKFSIEKNIDIDTLQRGFYNDLKARANKYTLDYEYNVDECCRKAWRMTKCRVLAKLMCI